ncbi:hypothetical protein [Massilia sp. TWP1-3-3]|uniref:hypothetical protein n=1 Tax=Massilia sp. TWP1-3-3 TaxID=2804573 RepID=UPI003CE78A57
MRDKKDYATFDLPGFGPASALGNPVAEARRTTVPRQRKIAAKQHQMELLDATDASGLPVWRRDDNTDLTGLPNWAAA